jgi:hypothetical protein
MFNTRDHVEFVFDDFGKRIYVQGNVTRVNELGCFVAISLIKTQDSMLISGGRTYRVGDEIYVMNSELKSTSALKNDIQKVEREKFPWLWLGFSVIFIILLIISQLR